MDWLTFIIFFLIIFCGTACTMNYIDKKYDNEKLQEENNKLKEKLSKRKNKEEK